MKKTLIYNAEIVSGEGRPVKGGWLLIEGGRIAAMGKGVSMPEADEVIDAGGDLLMPGMIDTHVHFRDPGLTHKADIASESAAAVAGGVTSFIDMPNTAPPTVSIEAWEAKMARAAEVSCANYAFYIGATNSNIDTLLAADYSRVPGVKLFLGSSTGNLLVDNRAALDRLFGEVKALIAVHAEDNARIAANVAIAREVFGQDPVPVEFHPVIRDARACLDSSMAALELAKKHGSRLHLLHVSTAAEARLLREEKPMGVTTETCVQYLTFCDADYATLGTRIKCNPAIKASTDRSALRKALKEGVIDIVASDHAPHLLSEKEGDALTAPSGMPNMQFQLVQLLDIYKPAEVVRMTASRPAEIFGIEARGVLKPGNYADIVRIARREQMITDEMSVSKCGWTPAAGMTVGHTVAATWVNGVLAAENGAATGKSHGMPLKFNN